MRPMAISASLFVLSFLLRLYRLGVPRSLVFDEKYYASDALDLLQAGIETGRPDHPPLGKWLIAGGIEIFGFTPVGWRFASVVAGSALVVATYLVGRVLAGGEGLGVLAALLVAVDGITFTMSRVAMLDIFFALFVVVGAGLGLVAIMRGSAATATVVGAASSLGYALAVKWSAAPVIVVVLAMFLVVRPRSVRSFMATVSTFAAVPVVIYLAVHMPWFLTADAAGAGAHGCGAEFGCAPSLHERVEALVDRHLEVLDDHRDLRPTNPYARPAWSWVTYPEPTVLFRKQCTPAMAAAPEVADDRACPTGASGPSKAKIATTGNPVLWAAAGLASVVLAWHGLRRRDVVALFLLLVGAALWVPWMLTPRHVYSFYAAPLVPVLAWWVVVVLGRLDRFNRVVAATVAVAAIGSFAWFYPALVALPLDTADPRLMIPFRL